MAHGVFNIKNSTLKNIKYKTAQQIREREKKSEWSEYYICLALLLRNVSLNRTDIIL